MISCFQLASLPFYLLSHILEATLLSISVQLIQNLQQLYIYQYGVDFGPFKESQPFHPVYHFLTLLNLHHKFVFFFPKEAYILLWYLMDLYMISIILATAHLLQYLAKCAVNEVKEKNFQLLKFLLLFGDITFWQRKLREVHDK